MMLPGEKRLGCYFVRPCTLAKPAPGFPDVLRSKTASTIVTYRNAERYPAN